MGDFIESHRRRQRRQWGSIHGVPYRGIEVITIDIDSAQLVATTSAAMDTVITG